MINTKSIVERGGHSKPNRATKLEIGLLSASMVITALGIEHVASKEARHRADCVRACAPVLGSLANRITLAVSVASEPRPIAVAHKELPRHTPVPKPIATHHPPQLRRASPPAPHQKLRPLVIPKVALQRSIRTNNIGNDVSYPDCPRVLPQGQLFGIVGINHGKPDSTNSCLVREMQWATTSTADSKKQKQALYVNTANPGASDRFWPQNNIDLLGHTTKNPYGACSGQETTACAWQYGWDRSVTDIESRFKPAARTAGVPSEPSKYFWWLDVETPNSWQKTDRAGQARDTAVLQGMTSALQHNEAKVGVYSTGYQWGLIVGDTALGNLQGLPEWIPGAGNEPDALAHCDSKPFTEGARILLVQFTQNVDYDLNCP
jgi:hypothetical protein